METHGQDRRGDVCGRDEKGEWVCEWGGEWESSEEGAAAAAGVGQVGIFGSGVMMTLDRQVASFELKMR